MRILYVENHPRFSSLVSNKLLADHTVVIVPSLEAAREKITNGVYDFVLLDFDLDDGKGAELVPLLLGLSERPKIIGTSAHDDGNQALLEAGADTICCKADISKIEEVIKTLF